MKLFDFLEKNTGKRGMYFIEFNPHISSCTTIVEELTRYYLSGEWSDNINTFEDFIESEIGTERYKRILMQDKYYYLQWYPRNTVSFNAYFGTSIEDLEEQVLNDKEL